MVLKSQNLIHPQQENPPQQNRKTSNNYRASVPISVYRQLVEELNTTKLDLENEKNRNQDLIAHNKQLEEEIVKIIVSAQNLLEINSKITESKSEVKPEPILMKTEQDSSLPEVLKQKPHTEKPILEVEDTPSYPQPDSRKNMQIKGFWLFMVIVLIILTCFMGSFFVVRFLQKNNNN